MLDSRQALLGVSIHYEVYRGKQITQNQSQSSQHVEQPTPDQQKHSGQVYLKLTLCRAEFSSQT